MSEQAEESTNNTQKKPLKTGAKHSIFFVAAARRITKRKIKHQQTNNNNKTEKTILRDKYNRPTDHGRYNEG